MTDKNEKKTFIRALAICAAGVALTGATATIAAALPTAAPAAPASVAAAPGAPAATHRAIDVANSQVILDGKVMNVSEKKSSWTSKDAIFVLRPHAQEALNIAGSTPAGNEKFSIVFNKTDIGPQIKSLSVNGEQDGARVNAQTVKFSKVSDSQDLAQVNLLTDGGHTIQFNILGLR